MARGLQHEGASRSVDEEVWDEMRNYKKCLHRMAAKDGQRYVFLETALGLGTPGRQKKHCFLEAVPVSEEVFDDAPIYFKKVNHTSRIHSTASFVLALRYTCTVLCCALRYHTLLLSVLLPTVSLWHTQGLEEADYECSRHQAKSVVDTVVDATAAITVVCQVLPCGMPRVWRRQRTSGASTRRRVSSIQGPRGSGAPSQ